MRNGLLGSLNEGASEEDVLLIPDDVEEGPVRLELQREGHHAGHHDHAGGSRRLRALLIHLDGGLVQHLGHKDALGDSSRLLNSAWSVNIFVMPS